MSCNGDCKQGRECDCGDPDQYLDYLIFIVVVTFLASALCYVFGGWR